MTRAFWVAFYWGWMAACAAVLILSLMAGPVRSQDQIMEPRKLAAYRAILPELVDEEWNEYLHSPLVQWYSNAEIPAAAQNAIGNGYSETTFMDPFYNISGDPSDSPYGPNSQRYQTGHGLRAGGGGLEFPWAVAPGGGHNTPGVKTFKGQLLLDKENWPIVVFQDELPGRFGGGLVVRGGTPKPSFTPTGGRPRYKNGNVCYRWVHPPDKAIYVEVVTQEIDGYDVPFEVRFRMRRADHWEVQIFNPVSDAADYAEKLSAQGAERAAGELLAERGELPSLRLFNPLHTSKKSFEGRSKIYELPAVDKQTVLEILSLPFENVTGHEFFDQVASPSNNTGQPNIVPHNWQGVFAGRDQFSCAECHQHTNRHVTEFQANRGWYGRIRGSDGIFTWHPIDSRSIATSGGHIQVRFRQQFVDSGRIRILRPGENLPEGYTFLEGVY